MRLLIALLISLPLFAQSGIWGQRGISRAFVLHGNILYSADGRGVAAYDVSGSAIARIDVESGDDETNDVAIMGNDLVLATSAGVERFAIAPNGTLTRIGNTMTTGKTTRIAANANYAAAVSGKTVTILQRHASGGFSNVRKIIHANAVTAVAFVGNYLYVATDREPARVYLPPAAESVDILPGVNAEQFALAGDVLWTASQSDGLTAIDVSNPAVPDVLSRTGTNELHLRGVAASGARVYAFESPDELHVFDASDPEEPVLLATVNDWVNVIAANATRIFYSGPIIDESGLAYDPGLIPRELGKPVRAIDATNYTFAAEYEDLAGPVSGVWTDGSVAYVVDPPYVRVLDVSTTNHPVEVTSLLVPNLQDRIRVKNGLAVIYGRAFVNLLDVSVPLRPKLIATWDAQGHPPSAAAILKTRVLEANEHSGMHVVDFSNAEAPVQVGGRIWHYRDIAASDDAAYAIQHDILLIVQIEEERTVIDQDLIYITHAQVDTSPPNASQPPLLLARGEDGLYLYSLEDRFHPVEIDFLPLVGLGVFGTGDGTAYIAMNGRLHFVDLTQELALQTTEMRVTSPMQISVAGQKIVIADRYSVRVYGPDTQPPPALPARRRPARH